METKSDQEPTPATGPVPIRWLLMGLVVVALAVRVPLLGDSISVAEACLSDHCIGTTEQLVATLVTDANAQPTN